LQATEIITHRAHYQNKKQNTEKYFFEWFHTCIEKNERIKVQIFCETSKYLIAKAGVTSGFFTDFVAKAGVLSGFFTDFVAKAGVLSGFFTDFVAKAGVLSGFFAD